MKNVLVVVDMQNDFLLNNGTLNLGHDTKELRTRVADYVRGFEGKVFVTYDEHPDDAVEFKSFPKHCLEQEDGSHICDEVNDALLTRADGSIICMSKQSYTSPAISEALASELDEDTTLHVVGVCTHICVHDIVSNLINHTKNERNFIPKVIVHKNMVDDFSPEMAEFALKRLSNLYGVEVA